MGHTESPPDLFTPLLISMLGIIATALALTIYHLMVLKFCTPRDHATAQHFQVRDVTVGVDQEVLNCIPIQAYTHRQRALHGMDQCECTVCLGELEEGDLVRILPHCHHVFHLQCIDEWLISHSNCPLCRSLIVAPTLQESPVTIDSNEQDAGHLPYHSQTEDSFVISIDDDHFCSARKSLRVALRRSSSFLSVERKPQVAFAPVKRSLSDCSYVSIKICSDHEDGLPSSRTQGGATSASLSQSRL
ncbi:hypothetical protein MRB53_031357 [Persea americana]|uniref:Uncharacterized protein n=1 Tax=Persea americana TaxID=3435 RepID=A0ACC2KPE7_PERAE|nr:hypothetical protein MRB53_031357 [Persea americana]